MITGIFRVVPIYLIAIVFAGFFPERLALADQNHSIESLTAKMFEQGRYRDAKKAFESDTNKNWRDPEDAWLYGEALLKLGKKPDAIKVWERIIRQYPRSESAKSAKYSILSAKTPRLPAKASGLTSKGPSALQSVPDLGILGIKFLKENGKLPQIARVFPGTPAERSHLQKGDCITAVDGVPTVNLTKDEMYDLLVGTPGTRVRLDIQRGKTAFHTELTRMPCKIFARTRPDVWKMYFNSL